MSVPRPEHTPTGPVCEICGLASERHRKRDRREYMRARRAAQGSKPRPQKESRPKERLILGIDGEGYTDMFGRHLYTFLCASDAEGITVAEAYNPSGLRSDEAFDFLLSLPPKALKVGFSLGYDYTKWIEDLPDDAIWSLYRPEERTIRGRTRPVRVLLGEKRYALSLVATKLSIQGGWDAERNTFTKRVTIWDLFRFFQRSFVASLREWQVGTEEELEQIQAMKNARGNFAEIGEAEKQYCRHECRLLAKMAAKLISACEQAGLKLRDFFGAGSLGAATLRDGLAKAQKARIPKKMRKAVACAFFGGRFEQSVTGPVPESTSYDLASAYPYAETQLPCLIHGKWRLVRGSHDKVLEHVRRARAACVRYELGARADVATAPWLEVIGEKNAFGPCVSPSARASPVPWGPFPFRLDDGTILFPSESMGGWVWHYEALAAAAYPERWPNLRFKEAWIFVGKCSCGRPYLEEVSRYYRQRLEWGKEGRGMVLKKGLASRYGKRAQTVGRAPFHCPVAAGLITSHTRGEMIHVIARAWKDCLSIATDGVIVRRPLEMRAPCDTGTAEAAEKAGKSPLGAWEEKDSGAIFLLRPGMRFAIEPKDGWYVPRVERDKDGRESLEGTTAARGVGVRRLHAERAAILEAWSKKAGSKIEIGRDMVFHGAKLSVTKLWKKPPKEKKGKLSNIDIDTLNQLPEELHALYIEIRRGLKGSIEQRVSAVIQYDHEHPGEALLAQMALAERKIAQEIGGHWEYKRSPHYGRWTKADPFQISYLPLPKRPGTAKDGTHLTWALGKDDGMSRPYDRLLHQSRIDVLELKRAQDEADAQPDQEESWIER
jgi:hypothetical protein